MQSSSASLADHGRPEFQNRQADKYLISYQKDAGMADGAR